MVLEQLNAWASKGINSLLKVRHPAAGYRQDKTGAVYSMPGFKVHRGTALYQNQG